MALVDWPLLPLGTADTNYMPHYIGWLEAWEKGEVTVSDLANVNHLPLASVVHALAETAWYLGELDTALKLLDNHSQGHSDPLLQMMRLRILLALPDENKKYIYDETASLQRMLTPKIKSQFTNKALPAQKEKIKLGFLCTYSYTAPVKFSLVPFFRHLDRSRFDITFFSLHETGQPLLAESCDKHVVILARDNGEIAKLIHEHAVDILFDLNGLLRTDFPLEVFSMKPARIQAGWWNTPLSSGLQNVDYYFSDNFTLDPVDHSFYSEKIITIPGTANFCYELPPYPYAPTVNHAADMFVFASFTALFKHSDEVLKTWLRIMKEAPHAMFYLKAHMATSQRFLRRFSQLIGEFGLSPKRFVIEDVSSFDEMMQKYALVDICLNTFGYGAGTTSYNALWQGVTTLTMQGQLPQGRGTASVLRDAGLIEFIVPDKEKYIVEAVRLAKNPGRLTEIRQNLRTTLLEKTTHFNPKRFATNFASACEDALQQARSNV